MLIACQPCHRQYDVADLQVGAKVRCLCGEVLEVPEVKPRDMEMLRCASCGGHLAKDEKDCGFCGSEVSLAERGFGGTCPECFARMAKNASFCSTCGVSIKPVGSLQPLHDKSCPRCDAMLAVQEFANGSIVECTGCGGVWLEEKEFDSITKNAEADVVSQFVTGRSQDKSDDELKLEREANVRYLQCPTCDQLMHRKNFATCSGVIIDSCRGHGVWFDRHELELILRFIAEGGMDQAREHERIRQEGAASRAEARRDRAMLPVGTYGGGSRRYGSNGPGSLLDALGGFLNGLF